MTDQTRIHYYERVISALDPASGPSARLVDTNGPDPTEGPVLILDASFNPPTVAHQAMIDRGRRVVNASRAVMALSRENVDKAVFGASLGERLAMMAALAAAMQDVKVAACSHARFIDKARALAPLFPGGRLVFAIGYDTLIRLFDAKYYDDVEADLKALFDVADILAANRGDSDAEAIDTYMRHPSRVQYRPHVTALSLSPRFSSVSSSEVRDSLVHGQRVSDVPVPVLRCIREAGLYSQQSPS